jgi:hypothetical protein
MLKIYLTILIFIGICCVVDVNLLGRVYNGGIHVAMLLSYMYVLLSSMLTVEACG